MTSAITRLQLLGDRADELTKYQADAEMREIERKRAREEREARARQRQAANVLQSQLEIIDQRIADHIGIPGQHQDFTSGWMTKAIGEALGAIKEQLRKEFRTAIDG